MNLPNDTKPRSREAKYYHARRARGDHLFRLWADPETSRKFQAMMGSPGRSEELFKRMVEREYETR